MMPFDLPSANLFDILHADLCRPPEVRVSRLVEDDEHAEHVHPVEANGNVVITPAPATVTIGTAAPVIRVSNS